MQKNNLHQIDEKGVRELIVALKVQIATVSMPLRGENRQRRERERETSVGGKLSVPCSIMGALNIAKYFKVRFGTERGAQRNKLYFKFGCECGYRSSLFSPPLSFFKFQLQQMLWRFFHHLFLHAKLKLFHLYLIARTLLV